MTKWARQMSDGFPGSGMWLPADPAADPEVQIRVIEALAVKWRQTVEAIGADSKDAVGLQLCDIADAIKAGHILQVEEERT